MLLIVAGFGWFAYVILYLLAYVQLANHFYSDSVWPVS